MRAKYQEASQKRQQQEQLCAVTAVVITSYDKLVQFRSRTPCLQQQNIAITTTDNVFSHHHAIDVESFQCYQFHSLICLHSDPVRWALLCLS